MASDVAGSDALSLASAEQAVGPYLRAIRRHWILIAVVTAIAGLVAIISVSRAGQTYQASASILVTPLPEGSSAVLGIGTVVDTGDPGQDVQTAAALIDTQEAAAGAAARLGRGWTAGGILSAITVTPVGAADVLDVTASASSATDAPRIANAFAESAIAYRAGVVQGQISRTLSALEARLSTLPATSPEAEAVAAEVAQLRTIQGPGREPTMSISQLATAPGSATGTAPWLIVVLALAGGLILGTVAALGLEAFSRPVRDRDEIASLYQLPVLASVPRVRGLRHRQLPPWELSSVGFEQIRMLRVQLSLGGAGRVIMVTSAGAGDGKTTVAAALAAAFGEAHQDVILIDLDTRKPDLLKVLRVTHTGVGRKNGMGTEPIQVPRLPRVKVIPATPGGPARFEALLRKLPDQLADAQETAGCVIIDTAPIGEVSDALRIAAMCDQVVVVARPRHTDRRRLRTARDLLVRAHAATVGLVLVGEDSTTLGSEYGYGYSTGLGETVDEQDGPEFSSASSEMSRDVEPG
ncbi:MAG TPA: Wzz/FepE/Etk N-terminal domain-containing protein [Solirubrobacteraceae bacterium]|nr:Wzz/FepE/Etk N-terminal domain-containing protein [Solirubrobacteraceae bacterium]